MNNLLDFPNKKERDDFYIALVVIALFGLFFWWLFCQDSGVPEVENIIPVVTEVEKTDIDGDGVFDDVDKCPELVGTIMNDGCPNDIDGDGIADADDKCPKLAGKPSNGGCPVDTDGDGVFDKNDNCPEVAGVDANNGCPADTDGDGVYDENDDCPNRAGKAENNGCPVAKITEAESALLERAMSAVEFNTGSAILKSNSQVILNQISEMLAKYPRYKLNISGHTDNQGDAAANQKLSEGRAQSCYEFLVSKGIEGRRLSYEGFGESEPKYSNDTVVGRQGNRRVEFKFHY